MHAADVTSRKSTMYSRGQLWQWTLWAAVLFCVLTLDDHVPFVLFERARPEHFLLVAAFLVTSLAFCWRRFSTAALLSLHLVVATLFFLSHPFAPVFERDGTVLVLGAYIATLLARNTRLRAEARLLGGSLLVGLLVLELGLAVLSAVPAQAWMSLPDYGDLMGSMKPGGMLKPNLDLDVVGEAGPVRFVTNNSGFRNREPAVRPKGDGEYRVLLLGDSFVAGYRMDQEATVGYLLGAQLSRRMGREVRVWPTLLGSPALYDEYLSGFAVQHSPDQVLIGITLGNDIGSAYAASRNLPLDTAMEELELPADAYRPPARLIWLRVHRSLLAWRWYRTAFRVARSEGTASWFEDIPTRVHLFDGMHGLGLYYARRELPEVRVAWAAALGYLKSIVATCADRGIRCVVFEIPQRFQTSEREWSAALFDYGLDADAFDQSLASRRLMDVCAEARATCIELLPALADAEQPVYLPNGDMHWNSRGHRIAARALADALMN